VAGTYFEDFAVGEVIDSPEAYEITSERLHAYAAEFDPQPMHLNLDAAERSIFGRLVASGWHTLSVTMRLMVGSRLFESGEVVGVGISGGCGRWRRAMCCEPGQRWWKRDRHAATAIVATSFCE